MGSTLFERDSPFERTEDMTILRFGEWRILLDISVNWVYNDITMKDLQEILITNLITLRKARGLTQIELGERVSYSDKTISKWENGDSCPNIEALYRLAEFYGVRIDDLLRADFRADLPIRQEAPRRRYSKLVITMLAVVAVWCVAILLFAVLTLDEGMVGEWLCFIYAVPVSLVTVLVFNTLWGNRRMNYLIISLLLWSLLTTAFLQLLSYHLWMVFLLGIPIQIAVILWSQLKKQI